MRGIWDVINIYIYDLIELWIILVGIFGLKASKKKSNYFIAGGIQCGILAATGPFFHSYKNDLLILYAILVIFSLCFLLEGRFVKKFALTLLAYVFVLFFAACIVSLVNITGNEIIKNIFRQRRFINILFIFILCVILLIKKIIKNNIMQIKISKRVYVLLFLGAGAGTFTLASLLVKTNNEIMDRARMVMIIVTIVIVIVYSIACLMIIFVTESRDNYKALSQINESIIESQQQYYNLVNEKQQEMRSIRHEMKNHFSCIRGLYNASKLQEMEQYINQLIETSDYSEDLFETGNDIVNAILNDAQNRYRKDNIAIRLEGGFPEDLKVAPMDLCVIFANTVSNAVEAIQNIKHVTAGTSYIDIRVRSFKDDLFIDIRNPIEKEVPILDGKLVTSKNDKSIHGFGVKNVIQRVEKYHGSVRFINEDKCFLVEIDMKNKCEK